MKKPLIIRNGRRTRFWIDGPSIVVQAEESATQRLPFRRISRLYFMGEPDVDCTVLLAVAKARIPVMICSPNGQLIASFIPPVFDEPLMSDWLEQVNTDPVFQVRFSQFMQHQQQAVAKQVATRLNIDFHRDIETLHQTIDDKLLAQFSVDEISNITDWLGSLFCGLRLKVFASYGVRDDTLAGVCLRTAVERVYSPWLRGLVLDREGVLDKKAVTSLYIAQEPQVDYSMRRLLVQLKAMIFAEG